MAIPRMHECLLMLVEAVGLLPPSRGGLFLTTAVMSPGRGNLIAQSSPRTQKPSGTHNFG